MPVYNHGEFLPCSLDSYLAQSDQVDEILLLDDASTDNTLEVMESYAAKHSHIRILRNEENRGVIFSQHRILREAKGDWCWYVAADDYPEPGSVETIRNSLPLAEDHDAGILFGKMRTVGPNGEEMTVYGASAFDEVTVLTPETFLNQFLRVEPPSHSLSASTIYNKRNLIEAGGQHEELGPWADTFVIRYLGLKHGAVYVPEVLNNWRMHDPTFSGRIRDRPGKQMKIFNRAVQLIRHRDNEDIFPEEYVEEFHRDIRRLLYRNFLAGHAKRFLGLFTDRYRTPR